MFANSSSPIRGVLADPGLNQYKNRIKCGVKSQITYCIFAIHLGWSSLPPTQHTRWNVIGRECMQPS